MIEFATQKGHKVMKEFALPVQMADGTRAQLNGGGGLDIPCDGCNRTIFFAGVRWIVEDAQGEKKHYHYQCYQPIVKA